MFLTFTDRDTPFSSIFSQLLTRGHIQYCKLNMLICITNVIVVFPSSPGPISVVFPMFSMCFTSLHLFAYGFKGVIQVHYVASIHLRGRYKSETWKTGLCSNFKVIKCLCSVKCKCKGWIPCLLGSGHLGDNCLYLCVSALGNVIQLEPEPSIRKAAELKYKIHSIWYKPITIQEMWSQFHQYMNDTLQSTLLWSILWEATFVDAYLLPRSTKEQKVIRNMTCPSIIFRTSDWGGNFSKKSEIYFYITW